MGRTGSPLSVTQRGPSLFSAAWEDPQNLRAFTQSRPQGPGDQVILRMGLSTILWTGSQQLTSSRWKHNSEVDFVKSDFFLPSCCLFKGSPVSEPALVLGSSTSCDRLRREKKNTSDLIKGSRRQSPRCRQTAFVRCPRGGGGWGWAGRGLLEPQSGVPDRRLPSRSENGPAL